MILKTRENKSIKLTKAVISVGANSRCENGLYVDLKLEGVIPRGRKNQILTYSPMCGSIVIRTLFGYSEWHNVDPEEFRKLVTNLEVVSDRIFPVELTDEIKQYALKHIEYNCDCPAIVTFNKKTGWYDKETK